MSFPLLLIKALKWGQEAWIWGFYILDSFKEGHVQSVQVGFPLLPSDAWKGGQEVWIWGFYKLGSFQEGHV